ncbi:MAG: hypothetical protein COZ11_10440 [Deltaproteobacteria bacterium CG_4_10_14_3_um_filter_51_14]|nr:MAG: hypothetical protein AUK25_05495 [Desulfobacteraceae bacterium CG2_30_51_40]PIY23032.1 MAG: hypothetical protein COZ11_10440 [Deltaproteobacteria bacterium CG_4_10_14_3_um_filter_51_14]
MTAGYFPEGTCQPLPRPRETSARYPTPQTFMIERPPSDVKIRQSSFQCRYRHLTINLYPLFSIAIPIPDTIQKKADVLYRDSPCDNVFFLAAMGVSVYSHATLKLPKGAEQGTGATS